MSSAAISAALAESAAPIVRTFGALPFHTDADILALTFADNSSLWSIEEGGVLRQWDIAAKQQTVFHTLGEPSLLWALSPATGLVAAGSDELQLWNAASGELINGWPQEAWISAIAFSPAGDMLATGHDDGKVRLWETARKKTVAEFRAHGQSISALAFSSDSLKLASAGEDKTIHLWDLKTQKPIGSLLGHTDRIPALACHPDSKRILSAGWDTTARVWDLVTCEPIILLNSHAGQVLTLALSPDGSALACTDSANNLHVWSLGDYKTLKSPNGFGAEIRSLAWSPNGKYLAAGGVDRVIHVWDAKDGKTAEQLVDTQASRTIVAVGAKGEHLLSLSAGTALRAWDTKSSRTVFHLQDGGALRAFRARPDAKYIAAARSLPGEPDFWHEYRGRRLEAPANMLGIWDARSGKVIRFLDGPMPPVTALAFSPDSSQLATGGFQSDDVWLWNVSTGEAVLLIPEAAGGGAVQALAWHPAGQILAIGGIDYLATGGSDGKTGVWNVEDRRPIAWIPGGGTALAFHPRGNLLAIASLVHAIRVWDVSGTEPRPALELIGHLDAATCLSYSPDGRLLATGSDDHSVRMWNASTGLQCGQIDLDTQIKSIAFASDGKTVFTGNGNTSCYQLDVGRILN